MIIYEAVIIFILKMAMIILLRHGQAKNNTDRILAGRSPGINLTDEGIIQVKNIARLIKPLDISIIYSSPIKRAKNTAEIISRYNSIKFITDDRLIELDMGRFTGVHYDELFLKYGNIFLKFYEGHYDIMRHGVETFIEVKKRVSNIVDFVIKKHPNQNVLFVTHMDPIKAMISNILELTPKSLFELIIANASMTIIKNNYGKLVVSAINLTNISRFKQNF